MLNKWREKFAGFMVGRYGADRLGQFLIGVSLFFLLLGIFIRKPWVDILAFACLILCYFRIFSRNVARRRAENQWYLRKIAPLTAISGRIKARRRQKNLYCFFKCPQCGTVLRVPKGKGHIRITCKCCGHVFERNS